MPYGESFSTSTENIAHQKYFYDREPLDQFIGREQAIEKAWQNLKPIKLWRVRKEILFSKRACLTRAKTKKSPTFRWAIFTSLELPINRGSQLHFGYPEN